METVLRRNVIKQEEEECEMKITKRLFTLILCLCVCSIFTSIKVEAAAGDTFNVAGEGYTATYEVLEDLKSVSLTGFELTDSTNKVTSVSLDETVKGMIDGEENTYTVTKIKNGVFANCEVKKYVVPSTVSELDGNPFESEDVVVLKKVYQMNGMNVESSITFDSTFYEGVKAVLVCGDSTSVAALKEICNTESLPDTIVPIEDATESTVANYSIFELKNGIGTTGLVREGSKLNSATVPMIDYVSGETIDGTLQWADVVEGEKEVKPEDYEITADKFVDDVTVEEYTFTYEKENYVSFHGSVKLSNTLVTETIGAFNFKLELLEEGDECTATLISCELVDSSSITVCEIPESISRNGKNYSITSILKDAFSSLDTVNTYIIPENIQNIEAGAFYDNSSDKNRVVVLRMNIKSKDKLPAIDGNYQKDDNKNNRLAMIFDPALKDSYNDLRNKYGNLVSWNEEFLQVAVSDVLTEKIMYGGKKTMDSNVFYDASSGKNTMAYVNTTITDQAKYKDFLTNAELETTVSWGGKETYVFNYAEGAQTFPYTISVPGYISVNRTQLFDPQSLSGFTYKMVNGTLCVTGYKGTATELVLSRTEADAYMAYSVTGIGGRSLTENSYQKLTIPASITSIEPDAFVGANYMKIVVEAGNPYYIAIDDFLYSSDKTTLIAAPSASGHVSLPEGTVKLGNYAFAGCSRVLSVIIPSTVTMIGTTNNGAYTFAWMRGFETIKFSSYNPAALTIMGNHMVEGSSLREVYYPEGTTAGYTSVMQGAGIYFSNDVKILEWKPTYNTIVSMDGTEVKYINPADSTKTYTWTSSNTDVVIVEVSGTQGKVTAVGNGEAIVTATAADGTSYKWTVNVTLSETVYKTAFPVSSVILGKKDGKKADQATINTISVPRGTTLKSVSVKNKKIVTAKLTKDKKGIIITSAKKTGKTTIMVTDANGKTATLNVTVKKAPSKKGFKLAKASVKIKKGETYQIKLKKSVACQKMTYSLSKASKKVVSVDKTGLVKAKKKGTAKITVKSYNGKTATLTIKVK